MPGAPWDNPDLDDFDYLQGSLEGAGDWADSDSDWYRSVQQDEPPVRYMATPAAAGRQSLPELATPIAKQRRFRMLEHFKGQTYARSEAGWQLDGAPFTFAPIVGRLETQLLDRLAREDPEVEDPSELVRRAWFGHALGHYDRVVDLTLRAMRAVVRPPDVRSGGDVVPPEWRQEALASAAMLCSAQRKLDDSQRGLDDTELFASAQYPPLMTSRAAAMCDVGRWDDASVLARRTRDIEASDEVINLLDRIDRHFGAETERAGIQPQH
jgi:hypothetical protein